MIRYNSLEDLETALQAIDPTTECHSVKSLAEAAALLNYPPQKIARFDGGEYNLLLVFTSSGFSSFNSVAFLGIKGGYYAVDDTQPRNAVTLSTPVEVRVHSDPAQLKEYLNLFHPAAEVIVYSDEREVSLNNTGFIIAQPGRYIEVRGADSFLFIRDLQGKILTIKA